MIRFSGAAERDLKKLPRDAAVRISRALLAIEHQPRHGPNIRKLAGMDDLYRLRVGDYRVVYSILGPDLVVSVIAHRGDVYRKARRR